MFLFLKLFFPSIFPLCLNEFNIKSSITSVEVLSTTHSSCHHLKTPKISYNVRLRDFFFLNKRSYLNLTRLVSSEVLAGMCPYSH